MADFETTVTGNADQASTEVWASALVQIRTNNDEDIDNEVYIDNSIDAFMARVNYTTSVEKSNVVVYFHNLKFDGSFIVDYLLKKGFSTAIDNKYNKWVQDKYMTKRSFKPTISDMGQWYMIKVKLPSGQFITFKDSLKLLPFSVEEIGAAFQTKHRKLEMEYIGTMRAGGSITKDQRAYITNDVLVVKEALEIMFSDDLNKLTIGACCKDQYKKSVMKEDLIAWFPSMYKMAIPENFGTPNADAYIRKAYKGGWCYLKEGCANQIYHNGSTADVNSLYPSMMISKNYPVGKPKFFKGQPPEKINDENILYFLRIKTRFNLKPGYLPTIQIKGSSYYKSNEWLHTSDVFYKGAYYSAFTSPTGEKIEMKPILTLTKPDFELLKEHYELTDLEYLDGCYFYTVPGSILFGDYVNKWAEIKKNNKGAKRTQAKLFLNNLYGKFSAKVDSTTKEPYLDDIGDLHYKIVPAIDPDKEWFIPVGAYVTSWAREFTIKAAQENYDSFIYADTDSIHCNCAADQIKGITVHPVNFCCWALEAEWDNAIFVRQKTYIEHVIKEDCEYIEKPYYSIKCAGMGKRPKELLKANLSNEKLKKVTPEEAEFLSKPLTLNDFKVGLTVPSNLKARVVPGGTLLLPQPYVLR